MNVGETSIVWIPVSDITRSLAFYRDRLGLTEVNTDGDWAELDAHGLRIGLNAYEDSRGSGGPVIAFRPEGGLEQAVEDLRGAGVEIAGEITEHPWGRVATFKDPDQNDLQLYEPPA
jgi:predicted enzyme related to lactoylglutathione lyase